MIPGKKYTPEEIVAMVWRRKWIVLLPFLVIGASTYFWAKSLPDSYRSETMIMVVPQRVPEQYVKPATTESIEDRLGTIREQILSRTRLESDHHRPQSVRGSPASLPDGGLDRADAGQHRHHGRT